MSENHEYERVDSSERLNAYIEALLAEATTANLEPQSESDARLWQMARLLKVAAHPEKAAPGPEFAADLEQRLLAQQRLLAPQKTSKSWWPHWLAIQPGSFPRRWAIATATILFLLLSFLAVPLIEQWRRPWPPLPALVQVVQAYWGMEGLPPQPVQLGDVSFELVTPLPAGTEILTTYRQEANPVTLADVEVIARRLGITGRVHSVGENFVADDGRQRLVISRAQKGYYHYQLLHPPVSSDQAPIQTTGAAKQAQTFLEEYGLLDFTPAAPQVTSSLADGNDAHHQVFFPQTVDGLVVENAGVTVILNEVGQVLEVTGRVILPVAVGRYPILSAAAAYEALQSRDTGRIFLVNVRQGQAGVVVHTVVIEEESEQPMPPIVYQPGATVELEGLLRATIFADNAGNPGWVNAFLIDETTGYAFRLLGPRLIDLAQHDQFHVRVWGMIVPDDQGQPALLVEDFRRSRPEEQFVTLLGRFVITERGGREQLLLLADDGELYGLPWSQEPEAIARHRPLADSGQKVLLSGTLAGDYASEGYPLLITAAFEYGSEINKLQSADERPRQRPQVVEAALPTLSGQAMIEEITLAYFTLPLPAGPQINNPLSQEEIRYLVPVYRFVGQTDEGTIFKVYVQASK